MDLLLRSILPIEAQAPPAPFRTFRAADLPGLGGVVRIEEGPLASLAAARAKEISSSGTSSPGNARIHVTRSHPRMISAPGPPRVPSWARLLASLGAVSKGASNASLPWLTQTGWLPGFKKLPYPALVRALIEAEDIGAARTLLAAALHEEEVDPYILKMRDLLAPPVATRSGERDVDRTREYRWLLAYAAQYRGHWVAVDGDALVAQAESLKDLLRKLKELGLSDWPLVHRIE